MGDTIISLVLMIIFFLIFMDIYKIRRNTDEIVKQNKQLLNLCNKDKK